MLSVVIHGGAGRYVPENAALKQPILNAAVDAAWKLVCEGAPGEEAVVAALKEMEASEYFNAGYGGYPNSKGIVLLDVGLMTGSRDFASLINVRRLKFPSQVALDFLRKNKTIMSTWTHELMNQIDEASSEIKERYGWVASHEELVAPFVKRLMEKAEVANIQEGDSNKAAKYKNDGHGTVGCVVRDSYNRISAGTSTGGVSLKANGRVGDTPIIGSGVFADNEICGLSTSGHGEAILLSSLSGFIIAELRNYFNGREKEDCKAIPPDVLERIVERELNEFSKKAPNRGAGVILIPKFGAAIYAHRSPMFAVGVREGTKGNVIREEIKISVS